MTDDLSRILDEFLRSDTTGTLSSKVQKRAGENIFGSGDRGRFMYFVENGRVQILFNNAVLEEVGPGGIVGEMALVDADRRRSAAARASENSMLIPINQRKFCDLVRRTPDFALRVMEVMARRIREMNERINASQAT